MCYFMQFWCFECYFLSKLFLAKCAVHGQKANDVRINFMSRTFHFNDISQAQICGGIPLIAIEVEGGVEGRKL